MPRRERDRDIARRRKRKKERLKLRNKGLPGGHGAAAKQNERKKPKKVTVKEAPKEETLQKAEASKEETPK
jgi:hypothetical protein